MSKFRDAEMFSNIRLAQLMLDRDRSASLLLAENCNWAHPQSKVVSDSHGHSSASLVDGHSKTSGRVDLTLPNEIERLQFVKIFRQLVGSDSNLRGLFVFHIE